MEQGPGQQYEEGCRSYVPLQMRVERGETFWGGLSTLQQREMDEALGMWLRAAHDGLAAAQTALGLVYLEGRGAEQSAAEAMRWFQKAADQNWADAQFNLGCLHRGGVGVPQSDKEASRLFRWAADQGHADAQFSLGNDYLKGIGVSKSEGEAMKWYQKAAEQGHAKSQYNLGCLFQLFPRSGAEQSDEEAVRWYRKAAERGHAAAQVLLLMFSVSTVSTVQFLLLVDVDLLWSSTKMTAPAPPHASRPTCEQYNLACMYEDGAGISQNDEKAARWYRAAADQDHPKAQFNLGCMCERAGHRDAEAANWYRRAARQGHPKVMFVSTKHRVITHIERDYCDILKLRSAVSCCCKLFLFRFQALFNLALMHEHGRGVPKDHEQALSLLCQAAAEGDEDAQQQQILMRAAGQAPSGKSKAPSVGPAIASSKSDIFFQFKQRETKNFNKELSRLSPAPAVFEEAQVVAGTSLDNRESVEQQDDERAAKPISLHGPRTSSLDRPPPALGKRQAATGGSGADGGATTKPAASPMAPAPAISAEGPVPAPKPAPRAGGKIKAPPLKRRVPPRV